MMTVQFCARSVQAKSQIWRLYSELMHQRAPVDNTVSADMAGRRRRPPAWDQLKFEKRKSEEEQ